jgi:hypothetical protein
MSDATSPAGILDQAAAVIQRNSWTQNQFYLRIPGYRPSLCPVCAGGGINVAAGLEPARGADDPRGYHADAIEAFARHVDPSYAEDDDGRRRPYASIGAWNDADGRTAEQVVTELKACAAKLRGEAS